LTRKLGRASRTMLQRLKSIGAMLLVCSVALAAAFSPRMARVNANHLYEPTRVLLAWSISPGRALFPLLQEPPNLEHRSKQDPTLAARAIYRPSKRINQALEKSGLLSILNAWRRSEAASTSRLSSVLYALSALRPSVSQKAIFLARHAKHSERFKS
jgi:hypothetical protein